MTTPYQYCSCKTDKPNSTMVYCSAGGDESQCPGLSWFHVECVQLTAKEVEAIEDFICKDCQNRLKPVEEESCSDNNEENVSPVEEELFVPKHIHRHATDFVYTGNDRLMFLIEWEGYPKREDFT